MPHIRCSRFRAVRSAVSRAAANPSTEASSVPGSTHSPSAARRSKPGRGVAGDLPEDRLRHVEASDDEPGLRQQDARASDAGGNRGLRGDVAASDVLGQRAADEILVGGGIERE